MKKLFLLLILFSAICSFDVLADTIYLKNGRSIEGEIVEQTDEFVKINSMGLGMFVKYKQSAIDKIIREDHSEKTVSKPLLAEKTQSVPKGVDPSAALLDKTGLSAGQTIDDQGYFLYIPQGTVSGKVYPLVVVFDPSGDAQAMIDFWKPIADEKKLIIYASKKFRNGVDDWFKPEEQMVKAVIKTYPVDPRRIITTGTSGGGMGAHMFAFYRPDLVRAVITSVGRINPFFKTDPQAKQKYPHNKIAVFLAGSSDFNNKEMHDDQDFLSRLYWKTKWLEFEGGHMMAPPEFYKTAIDWIEGLWS